MNCTEQIKKPNILQRIDNHNLCFLSPIDDPLKGIAIGDGSTGYLIWPEKDRLAIAVNHTDLWDLSSTDEIHNWADFEEEHTNALRHAGRLELRFSAPVLDLLYQKDYHAELSLKNATVNLNSVTPFSSLNVTAYASSEFHCALISASAAFDDENTAEVYFENWGSRTFGHWYAQIRRDASLGITDTQADAQDDFIYITRKLGKKAFCIAVKITTDDTVFSSQKHNKHSVSAHFNAAKQQKYQLAITVAIAKDEDSAKADALHRLNVFTDNLSKAYSSHCAEWAEFWQKSFVELDNNYIENLWYLNAYYGQCEMRGLYPPHFCNGIWGFQHDYVPWNHFFHWNMQLQYWAHFASGHGELVKAYLDFRFRQLPAAIRTAEKHFGVKGALYTDVSGANAVCDVSTLNNLTPGSQIGHCFWLHYRYTGDFNYLFKKGFPVIYHTALLYANLLRPGEDGYYHLFRSQAYESSPIMDDVITDRGAIQVIITDAIASMNLLDSRNMLDASFDKRSEWQEILDRLYPIQTIPMEDDEYTVINGEKRIASGIGAGRQVRIDAVPVTGIFCGEERNAAEAALEDQAYWSTVKKGDLIRSSFSTEHLKHYYGFPDPEYSAVFPNSCIGLKEKDSKLFCAMENIMNMKKPICLDGEEQVMLGQKESVPYMGWSLDPIIFARLGMADDLSQRLEDSVKAWQWYPNGMGHYGDYEMMIRESNLRFYTHDVRDCDSPDNKFSFPAWPFRHFDLEMLPIMAMAVNEMLLQSYDGSIRVFPACKSDFTGSFMLDCEGGVTVYSSMTAGRTDYVYLIAANADIILENPWNTAVEIYNDAQTENTPISRKDGREISLRICGGVLVLPIGTYPDSVAVRNITLQKNTVCKRMGRSTLGIERMF